MEKSLIQKLGYQPDEAVDTLNAPEWFLEYLRGNGVHTHAKLPTEWLHVFVVERQNLDHIMHRFNLGEVSKGIWVSWPKKNSDVPTDLTEQTLRDIILPLGWVDVKVCAINDTWSGLKFVRRKTRMVP